LHGAFREQDFRFLRIGESGFLLPIVGNLSWYSVYHKYKNQTTKTKQDETNSAYYIFKGKSNAACHGNLAASWYDMIFNSIHVISEWMKRGL
jgi:hypothetical protein